MAEEYPIWRREYPLGGEFLSNLPPSDWSEVCRYIEHGVALETPHVIAAVTNSARLCAERGILPGALVNHFHFFSNASPFECHGSAEKYLAWRKAGGLEGIEATVRDCRDPKQPNFIREIADIMARSDVDINLATKVVSLLKQKGAESFHIDTTQAVAFGIDRSRPHYVSRLQGVFLEDVKGPASPSEVDARVEQRIKDEYELLQQRLNEEMAKEVSSIGWTGRK